MRNLKRYLTTAALLTGLCVMAAGTSAVEAKEYTAGPMTISVPDEVDELCEVDVKDDQIEIRDRKAREDGWGGFVESFSLYKDSSEYVIIPHFRHLGVITLEDGTVWNVVAYYPTDVQYDPRVEDSTYSQVSAAMEAVEESVTSTEGGTFTPSYEMDTTSVFDPVLEKVITAINERTDRGELIEMDLSDVYAYTYDLEGDPLDKIGYAYTDLDGDGYKELILGSLDDPSVYDMYINVEGEPVHLLTSGERSMYSLCGRGEEPDLIRLSASGSAFMSEFSFYILCGPRMFQQTRFIYDASEDPDAPWFVGYWADDKEPISEEDWNERLDRFNQPVTPDYTPLSGFAK